jgi:hypothetical protein
VGRIHGSLLPSGDRNSIFTTYGYGAAELLVQVLQQCGDDLSRENIMRQAANLKKVKLDLLLPGLSISTSRTDLSTGSTGGGIPLETRADEPDRNHFNDLRFNRACPRSCGN